MVRRAVSVVLALLVLAGCGTRPTGHGAPPYQEPTHATPAPLVTDYPALHLRFTLPAMAGGDQEAVRAYIGFSVAALRTWRSGRAAPALRTLAQPPMRRLVLRLAPTQRAYGALGRPTLTQIRAVTTEGVLGTILACVHHAGTVSATGVLLVQGDDGRWRVSATGPAHRQLKNCG